MILLRDCHLEHFYIYPYWHGLTRGRRKASRAYSGSYTETSATWESLECCLTHFGQLGLLGGNYEDIVDDVCLDGRLGDE